MILYKQVFSKVLSIEHYYTLIYDLRSPYKIHACDWSNVFWLPGNKSFEYSIENNTWKMCITHSKYLQTLHKAIKGDEINQINDEESPKSTKRQTKWGIAIFTSNKLSKDVGVLYLN